jgi:hypothetical protein
MVVRKLRGSVNCLLHIYIIPIEIITYEWIIPHAPRYWNQM